MSTHDDSPGNDGSAGDDAVRWWNAVLRSLFENGELVPPFGGHAVLDLPALWFTREYFDVESLYVADLLFPPDHRFDGGWEHELDDDGGESDDDEPGQR